VRSVVATLFASVDGYASDAPDEEMRWVTDDIGEQLSAFALAQLRATETLVLGRVTYEMFASYWPSAGDEEGEFAELMNGVAKVVVSKSLKDEDVAWSNTRVARGDLAEEILALKRQPGKDIGLNGSVELVGSLMKLGLVDRLQLQVHPIVLGPAGGRAIFDGYDTTRLRLVESTVLDDRVVVLDYQPVPADGAATGIWDQQPAAA
jgi:dihydrofolate reductase